MSDLAGFLQKLSPKIFVGYQQRYITITDQGKVLAYFKNGPAPGQRFPDEEPRGVVNLAQVYEVKVLNGTDFCLCTTDRDYTFRATTAAEKDRWCEGLRQLIANLREKGFTKEEELSKEKFTNMLQSMVTPQPGMFSQLTSTIASLTATNVKIDTIDNISVTSMLSRVQVAEAKGLVPCLSEAAGGSIRTAMQHVLTGSATEIDPAAERSGRLLDNSKRRLLFLVSSVGIATENPYTVTLRNALRDNTGTNVEADKLIIFDAPQVKLDPTNRPVPLRKLPALPDVEEVVQGYLLRLPEHVTLLFDSRADADMWHKAFRVIRGIEQP